MRSRSDVISDVISVFGLVTFALLLAPASARRERSSRPPYILTADVLNSTSVVLRWRRSADDHNHDDACPVRLFFVRLRQDDAPRVRTWKVDGQRTSVSLHGLIAATNYHVRVVAVDCKSRRRPSRWVTVATTVQTGAQRQQRDHQHVAETMEPGQPIDVTTTAFSNSIVVSWRPPDDGAEVRGYVVGYGEGVPDVSWQYLEPHRRNVTIRNLKMETQYVVSVRAFNNVGKGPVVYDLVYTSDSPAAGVSVDSDSPPLMSPTSLHSKVLSSTTIWLQWTDPSRGTDQTAHDSRYYNVHYQAIQPVGKALSAVARDQHVILYNLAPATRYEFRVRTVKGTQTSHYSATITNSTFETAPSSAPRDVTVTQSDDDVANIQVRWRPPRHTNGNVTEYVVLYSRDSALPVERWQIKSVGRDTRTSIGVVNSTVDYFVRVQARNSHGFGPKSDAVRFRVMPPSSELDVGDSLNTTTESVNGSSSLTDDQQTQNQTAQDDDVEDDVPTEAQHRNDSLSPKYKRQHRTDSRHSSSSASDVAAAADFQHTKFGVALTHHVTAFVTWPQSPDAVCSRGRKVVGYELRYRRAGDSDYVSRYLTENVLVLDDLAPNTRYRYQLQYVTAPPGDSLWTQEAELDTTP